MPRRPENDSREILTHALMKPLLDAILPLRVPERLPLHIFRRVRTSALQRHDVIDHVARARSGAEPGRRTRMQLLGVPAASLQVFTFFTLS
jgi:hypothetical protein